ncbi:MAG: APC family permease, partial [Clostridia bacterium]|nr:APC family permease [Clostridia bacterium]
LYTCTLFNWDAGSGEHLVLAAFYLILGYAMNSLSPKLAGRFQVSTTFIKLIPLALMAIIGTIVGLINGQTVEALTMTIQSEGGSNGSFFAAVAAFAFAYEGWIITTSINAELKDSKKNLPRALIIGSIIVILVYLAYYLGLTGALSSKDLMASGNIPKDAFAALFGNPVFGTIAYVFVIISCLGTMNGLMLGCCRGMYSVAARGMGPAPKVFNQVDRETNMPTNSSIFGLIACAFWMLQWHLGECGINILPGIFAWENDELPIITLYAAYIPIFLVFMAREKDVNPFKRFVMPVLAIITCVFMVYAASSAYKMRAVYYLIVFAVVMVIGYLLRGSKERIAAFNAELKE